MKKILYMLAELFYNISKKIFKKIEELEHFEWLEYKHRHKEKDFICGIDNRKCAHNGCWDKKAWEHHECMYLKGYQDY